MKLQSLNLTNFLAYGDLTIDLSAPVNVIVGRNGVGKTAIANAIELALSGRARGVKYKKDLKDMLSAVAGKPMTVELETSEGTFTRGMPSPKWSEDLLNVATSHLRLLAMSQADRQKVFGDVLGAANDETIGEAIEAASGPGCRKDLAECAALLSLSARNIDQAEKLAVENRRAAGRAAKELDAAVPDAPADVEINGEVRSVAETDPDRVQAKMAELRRELGDAEHADDPKELEAQAEEYRAKADMAQEEWAEARGRLSEIQDKIRELQPDADSARLHTLKGSLEGQRRQLSALMDLAGQCVLTTKDHPIACPLDKRVVEDLRKRLNEDIQGEAKKLADRTKQVETAKAELAEAKGLEEEAKAAAAGHLAEQRHATAEAERLSKLAAAAGKGRMTEAAMQTLRERIATGETVLSACTAYRTAATARKSADTRIAALTAEQAAWDALAKLLGADGPVRKHLAEPVSAVAPDAALQAAWGCKVAALPDGSITWTDEDGTRMLEMCSRSEQWRGCMLVADLLVRASGMGLIVLDDVDTIVSAEDRGALSRWAAQFQANGYESIVMIAAKHEPPRPASIPDHHAMWWVDKGHVAAVKPQAVIA